MMRRFKHAMQIRAGSVRFLTSGGSDAYTNYLHVIHKKFLFWVHPDFFAQQPEKRAVNSKNLQSLQMYVDALAQSVSYSGNSSGDDNKQSKTRSLIFYVKQTSDMPDVRKIKLSTASLLVSMREILEDYDVELPDSPAGRSGGRGSIYHTAIDDVNARSAGKFS
jgi:hypothetical protein